MSFGGRTAGISDHKGAGGEHDAGGVGRLQAVDDGHADVHEEDVRPLALRHRHRLAAVCGLPDDLDVRGGLQEDPEARADELLVVRDRDADHVARSRFGISAATRKPPARSGPASRRPPCMAARSRIPMMP